MLKEEGRHIKTYHVSGQDDLATTEVLVEIGASKRARVVLVDNLLSVLGCELVELFGELGAGCEDGCAIGCVVNNVDNLSIALAVLLKQRGNDLARGCCVGALQFAFCVFVLSVNDDESAVGNAGSRWLHADELAERGCGRHD